ncbi:GNAT family N-acetyltransferase [Thermoflexus sp.]|uniref:GNAT family N-acetyltransferase n=1 Tax=Thermoflexus sp. TaxID=1969742 RepID=UPI0025F0AD43|nr:GNAT family N-acetyltransferase [Thermoflexus sp.]MDW8180493.1 GNAT family N-acetyltransferase [Anaerolineae bacterium]MCS6962466.1 GNAT family N-acetyltransferase [Thermoflexus sp.]MCS7351040.1 GNAT family N-acetyltransferase [Thermoflexus sp.]MCX7690528.1 GNAT family N-acetyltransferase [Thermoflexus sp.]MDW8183980.1 GNAT family N-acetyltransferase [Anaerolineae bacterium]
MFVHARPATRADRTAILQLIRGHRRAQLALDWWSLEEWLDAPTAWVVERMGRIVAFWLGIQVDSPVAWLRGAAVADDEDAVALFRQLWPHFARAMVRQGAEQVVGMAYGEWLEPVYQAAGFTQQTVVITLRKDDWRIPEIPAAPVHIRRAMLVDIPRIAEVDRLAFEPMWWYGPTILTRAWRQVPYFIVAEEEGKIIGYAFTDLYGMHGHIVRLAVHPAHQGRAIGARLLAESLRYLIDLGAYPITLNTQIENQASQALYRRFGFHPTGQEISIWGCSLKGE